MHYATTTTATTTATATTTTTTLRYTTLHYTPLHYTNYIALLHYATSIYIYNYSYTTLHCTRLHYTIPYTTLQYTTLQCTTPHYSALHYTTLITPHHIYNCNYNCANYITLQLQLQYATTTATTALHHTTSSKCGEVTTATIATTPKTQFQPPFGPSVDSLCHPWFTTTNLSCRFPIFETSATALCGTTGISFYVFFWGGRAVGILVSN